MTKCCPICRHDFHAMIPTKYLVMCLFHTYKCLSLASLYYIHFVITQVFILNLCLKRSHIPARMNECNWIIFKYFSSLKLCPGDSNCEESSADFFIFVYFVYLHTIWETVKVPGSVQCPAKCSLLIFCLCLFFISSNHKTSLQWSLYLDAICQPVLNHVKWY